MRLAGRLALQTDGATESNLYGLSGQIEQQDLRFGSRFYLQRLLLADRPAVGRFPAPNLHRSFGVNEAAKFSKESPTHRVGLQSEMRIQALFQRVLKR